MTSAVQIAPEEKYLELIFDIGTIFKAEDRNERMVKYLIVIKEKSRQWFLHNQISGGNHKQYPNQKGRTNKLIFFSDISM